MYSFLAFSVAFPISASALSTSSGSKLSAEFLEAVDLSSLSASSSFVGPTNMILAAAPPGMRSSSGSKLLAEV